MGFALRGLRFWLHASLAFRVALASALFGLFIVVTAMGLGYWSLSRQLNVRAESELLGKREIVVHLISEMPSAAQIVQGKHRFNEVMIGHHDLNLSLVDEATSSPLLISSAIAQTMIAASQLSDQDPAAPVRRLLPDGTPIEALAGSAPTRDGRRIRYQLTLDRGQDSRLLRGFLKASLPGTPFLLLIVAAGAWLMVSTALAPLRRFRRLAASISTRNLHQRVTASGLPAEVRELALDFNSMLERIDRGYQRLEEFTADLAHELRTPIATLLGRNQVMLSQPRTAAQLQEAMEGDVEELERLSRLIADMLFLAQSEHGPAARCFEPVSLREEADRVAEYLAYVADETRTRIEVSGHATTRGDRLLIQRAITNLLSNGIRHARTASTVRVAISSETDGAVVKVINEGEPVPPELRERIFDRFVRADASRTRRSGGTGLGLAIVRSIMQVHGGSVALESNANAGETAFALRFPHEPSLAGGPPPHEAGVVRPACDAQPGLQPPSARHV